jgi:hypothetical protein
VTERSERSAGELIIVCSHGHRERTIRHLYLNPRTDQGLLMGIVTMSTKAQRAGLPDPNAHGGEHGKWRFKCQEGCYDIPISQERLQRYMEKLDGRVIRLELKVLASLR